MTAMHDQGWLHGMKYWFLVALWMGDEQSRPSLVFESTPERSPQNSAGVLGKDEPPLSALSACSLHLCLIQTGICILSNSYPNFMA